MNENQKAPEVADVFNASGDAYIENHRLSCEQRKAIEDIRNCRTANLGGHTTHCPTCGIIDISYNSCRNRNCPKCGFQKKIKWLYHRKKDVLPITYYHVVFTLPEELNPLFLFHPNQKLMYQIFFQSVAKTIELLAKTDKYFCGKPGMIATLHTWGQILSFHPHIHCILTGGGLDTSNNTWTFKDEFLFPIKVQTENTVSFYYKDYRDNKQKVMTLEHEEFIRRFLQHVVPSGFMRIRYYGILDCNFYNHRRLLSLQG